jgi:hypothetical protein
MEGKIWYKCVPIDAENAEIGTRVPCKECTCWVPLHEFPEHGNCLYKLDHGIIGITLNRQLCNETGAMLH